MPITNDDVVIGAGVTVTHRSGFNKVNSVNCAGRLALTGGTLELVSNSVVSSVFTLHGGTLSGSGDLTAAGMFFWTNGAMSGLGRTMAAGGMVLAGALDKVLDGRTLINGGNAFWRDSGRIIGINGAVFENAATFTAENDSSTAYICCVGAPLVFTNPGVFRKIGGTNRTQLTSTAFHNFGLADVRSGILQIGAASSGTGTGEFRTSAGTAVEFAGTGYTLSGGSVFTGAGVVRHLSGMLRLNADVTVPSIEISSGIELAGGRLMVTSNALWTAGNLTGAGALEIKPAAILALSGGLGRGIDGGTVNNAGTTIWRGSGNIHGTSGGVFNNLAGAVFETRGDAAFTYICCVGAPGTFNNLGAFRKTGGTNATTFSSSLFHNRGTVEVLSGRVDLSASSGTNSGSAGPRRTSRVASPCSTA